MKVAILGAGFAGLAAAYDLVQAGHAVTIYEKAPHAGGAAGGFKLPHWDWHLDFAYHHLFTSDADIVRFCKEIGWSAFITRRPITASSYAFPSSDTPNPQEIYKLDTPLDLLTFPKLSLLNRIRAGIVLAALKFGPPLAYYHNHTAYELLSTLMGTSAWNTLWEPLFSHKYGTDAHTI
ncbi:MAG: FAD-dependent oxidoreductase, partial [Candidatus Roizmanbacteria bacterium]|nr:FAD-dependent oxidoreductase [Candidatus Roizmanbacteria bacterium]